MSVLREWLLRLWSTLTGRRGDHELEQELRFHLELAEEEARRRGVSRDAARLARVNAGGVPQAMESLRDQRGLPWVDDVTRDVRYGLRALRKNPTFTTVALVTLAVGIGANTAVFSVVNGVLIKPLPYPQAEQLIAIQHVAPGAPGLTTVSGDLRLSPSMFFTYAEQNRSFQAFGVWFPNSSSVTGLAEPEQVRTVAVSEGTLEALGVQPVVGRWLSASDQKPGSAAIMLGYGYWQRRFGGDPAVIGRTMTVDSRSREVVGVMPEGFRVVTAEPELIVPLGLDRARTILPGFGFSGIGRAKPGVTIAEATADIARLIPIWNRSWPAFPGVNPLIYESWKIAPALRPLKQDVVGNVTTVLWVLMATIGIVMLIACANVANLLLVRAEKRQQELAVRAALGAGSGRIVRALLVESLLLAFIGGAVGLVLARVGLRVLIAMGPTTLPRLHEVSIDPLALLFTFGLCIVSGLLFGAIPALKYVGPRLSSALHGSARTSSDNRQRHRTRSILVVAQVALALVLLVSAGLMIRTSQALRRIDPGFSRAGQLQIVRFFIPNAMVPDAERTAQMQKALVDRLAAVPGVESVGFTSAAPMEGITPNWDSVVVEGGTYSPVVTPPFRLFKGVSPGLFQTLGTRLVAGRDYTWADLEGRRDVAIVSENLARELWGTPSAAIGKRIKQGTTSIQLGPWKEIIGVVQDVRDNGVHAPAPATVYWLATRELLSPAGQMQLNVTRATAFVIRSPRTGTDGFLGDIRNAVWAVNGNLPLASVRTMQEMYERALGATSFALVMLTIAGSMALLLGLVGIYGVISYVVSQRTREIGIRVALGAERRELKRMFVGHALKLAAVGVVIGLVAAVGLTRLMASLLFGTSPLDPMTFAAMPIVLAAAAALASYVPARRAASVDPVEALKAE